MTEPKLFDNSLNHENPQIHYRLLKACEDGKRSDFGSYLTFPFHVFHRRAQFRKVSESIYCYACRRYELGRNSGCSSSFDSEGQKYHKQNIENHIQYRRNRQKNQRRDGIAHRPEQCGEKIIYEDSRNSCKDDEQILSHQRHDFSRNVQQFQYDIDSQKG